MSNISIDFTEQDLADLMDGETFDWHYETKEGEMIEVHLYKED